MTDTIRIYRQRVIEYDLQEYIDLTPEEYAQVVEIVGADASNWSKAEFEDIDSAVDSVIGYAWEIDFTESGDDRTVAVLIGEGE